MAIKGTESADGDLKKSRRAAGLSQQRVAELAGCSVGYVQVLEGGYRPRRPSDLVDRIIEVLHEEGRPAGNGTPLETRPAEGRHGRSYP